METEPVTVKPSQPEKLEHLLVTAATPNYIWGLLLLLGSLRKEQCALPVLIQSIDLPASEINRLASFKNIIIIDAETNRTLHDSCSLPIPVTTARTKPACLNSPLFKVVALEIGISLARTVTWVDADCIISADISAQVARKFSGIRIRVRDPLENGQVFLGRNSRLQTPDSRLQTPESDNKSIPIATLQQWQQDINQNKTPRITTQVVTNCFSIRDTELEFVLQWGEAMKKAGIDTEQGVVHKQNRHYFMTDESAMTALLAFGQEVPDIAPYNLGNIGDAHIIHFGEHPKPWNAWQLRHFTSHYERVQSIINWLAQHHALPATLPKPLNPKFRRFFYVRSYALDLIRRSKQSIKTLWAR